MAENVKNLITISQKILVMLFDGVRLTTNNKVEHERNI
jgi:hypothetical protein